MITIPGVLAEWTEQKIVELLDAHVDEDARLDWKEDLRPGFDGSERFVRGAVGMANGVGGFVVLGVADSKALPASQRLVGVEAARDVTQQVAELLKHADPPVPIARGIPRCC